MDVDPGSPISSGRERAPTSPASSANKRLKPVLPTDQLSHLNKTMGIISRRQRWERRIVDAQNDDSQWRDLVIDVLMCLLLELSTTNLKRSVIAYDKAESFVHDLTDEELKECVNGVQTGVKENDWEHLIMHRTCTSCT